MKQIKVYPPKGGEYVECHPAKLDEMLSKGWTLEKVKPSLKPSKEK